MAVVGAESHRTLPGIWLGSADGVEAAYDDGRQSAIAAAPPAPAAPVPQPVGGASADDIVRLKQLGELHEQGVLTDDEFAREKARTLGA